MSKEKQIEEMAKALTKYEKGICERLPKDKCLLTSAVHAQVSCDYCKIAEFLYNAGYRKQSKAEWVDNHCTACGMTPIGEETWTRHGDTLPKFEYFMSFCPNCGASMKGGAE